ncbi:MAG TPA: selenide, water dikinase SelD [Salinivirgaceae bacterium]|nr:selenide, water dikinase SelD [Salinivirgaceae bacterium]
MEPIRLTQFSHGAGCGCKISPKVLTEILSFSPTDMTNKNLLVGNAERDDAAVYDLGDGTAIISTTDFFMPIVDDPFTFGKIAAVNAISDVYAMGGTPLVAIAILGWPVDKLSPEIAGQVLEGGKHACSEAGIAIAGGHSIDSPEPIFGLAVTGRVKIENLKRNNTAKEGDFLYLTKPLGVGILTTAQKQGKLLPEHADIAPRSMCQLNKVGELLGKISGVTAMTDVTGFGLLGHLAEMCDGANLTAIIDFAKIPTFDSIQQYIIQKCIPGGTYRNWDSYGHQVQLSDASQKFILCDPQTSGGLLIAVDPAEKNQIEEILRAAGIVPWLFGQLVKRKSTTIEVQ